MGVKRSAGLIFGFFFPLGWKTGKTRALALLGLFPVLLAVVARVFLRGRTGDMSAVFYYKWGLSMKGERGADQPRAARASRSFRLSGVVMKTSTSFSRRTVSPGGLKS